MPLTPKQAAFVAEYLIDLNATQAAIRAGLPLDPCTSPKGYYVYLLIDAASQTIIYVGKGKGRRYSAHLRLWRNGQVDNARKIEAIDAAMKSGGLMAVCFAEGLQEDVAFAVERELIRGIGLKNLSNAVKGQTTEFERSKVEARLLLDRAKPFAQWVSEKPRTEREIEIAKAVIAGLTRIAVGEFAQTVEVPANG